MGFFVGGVFTVGGAVTYVFTSRKNNSGEPLSKFELHLAQRKAALGALPIGLIAVAIGAIWYMLQTFAPPGLPLSTQFADFNTPGVIALLGFGTLYVSMATWLAIRAERAAVRVARADIGVTQ
ncbi:MAG: hypothetical protein ACYDCK_00825 [Thermoplasmatota archaeon]